MTVFDYEDPADPSPHEPSASVTAVDDGLPEPAAHMYPSDLLRFASSETFATAFSVEVGSPDEHSEPLYTADQMRAAIADERDRGASTWKTANALAEHFERLWYLRGDELEALRERHAEAVRVGSMLANTAYNWAQRAGYTLTSNDAVMLDTLRKKWDAALAANGEAK